MTVLLKRCCARTALLGTVFLFAGCGGGSGGPDEQDAASAIESPASEANPPAAGPAPASPSEQPQQAQPMPESTALSADQTCGLADFQQAVMKLINEARASSRSCGATAYSAAPALKWNGKLFDAAASHSADMAANNYFSHTGRNGSTFSQRITAAGYAWRTAGENIAAGQAGIPQVMAGWLQSPGHCANIMNKAYTDVAVSCSYNASSTYKYYWTMELAAPR